LIACAAQFRIADVICAPAEARLREADHQVKQLAADMQQAQTTVESQKAVIDKFQEKFQLTTEVIEKLETQVWALFVFTPHIFPNVFSRTAVE
jgi:peptidoglycan hydrolase CwlO-like protein